MNGETRNIMYDVVSEVTAERERQIELHQWTADHDDSHPLQAWGWLLARRAIDLTAPGEPLVDARRWFVEIAAIAVAAIESMDRKCPSHIEAPCPSDPQGQHYVGCGCEL